MSSRENTVKEVPGMCTGPMMPLLARLALPLAAGICFQRVCHGVDAVFASLTGRSDPSCFGAAVGSGLMIGTNSTAAGAVGSGNHHVLDRTADSRIVIALLISLFTIAARSLFDTRLVSLLGAEGDYAVHGLEYLRFIAPGMGIMLIGTLFFGILQGEGHMKLLMWALIIGTVGISILDPICIFLPDMKLRGEVLAAVIARGGSILFVITLFAAGKTRTTLHWKRANVSREVIREIVLIGFPQALSMLVMSLAFIIINRIVISLDGRALTAFALNGRFGQALFIPIFAVGMLFAVTGIFGRNIFQRLGFPISVKAIDGNQKPEGTDG